VGERNLDIFKEKCKIEPNAKFLDNFAKLSNHKFEKKTPAPNPHGHNLFCWIFKITKKQNLIIFQNSKTI
jgi:hypothetical protein